MADNTLIVAFSSSTEHQIIECNSSNIIFLTFPYSCPFALADSTIKASPKVSPIIMKTPCVALCASKQNVLELKTLE